MPVVVLVLALGVSLLTGCDRGATVLSGSLSLVGGGSAPQGVVVTAFGDDTESIVATTMTDAAGAFGFGEHDLAPGDFRLRFGDGSWWQDSSDWSSSATTAADGTYEFTSLSARTVIVEVTEPTYVTWYSGGTTTLAATTAIEIDGSSPVSGVDVTLLPRATLTGSVGGVGVDRSGFVIVVVEQTTQQPVRFAMTASTGTFTFDDLAAGSYGVTVIDPSERFRDRAAGSTTGDLMTGRIYVLGENQTVSVGVVTLMGAACPIPSAQVDLTGFDFAGANLAGASLSLAQLHDANLAGADLSGVYLNGATMQGTVVAGTNLVGATFDGLISSGLIGVPGSLSVGWIVQNGELVPPNG